MATLSLSLLDSIGLQVPTYRPTTIVYPMRHRGSSFMRFPLFYYLAEDANIESIIPIYNKHYGVVSDTIYQLNAHNILNIANKQVAMHSENNIETYKNFQLTRQEQSGLIENNIALQNKDRYIDKENFYNLNKIKEQLDKYKITTLAQEQNAIQWQNITNLFNNKNNLSSVDNNILSTKNIIITRQYIKNNSLLKSDNTILKQYVKKDLVLNYSSTLDKIAKFSNNTILQQECKRIIYKQDLYHKSLLYRRKLMALNKDTAIHVSNICRQLNTVQQSYVQKFIQKSSISSINFQVNRVLVASSFYNVNFDMLKAPHHASLHEYLLQNIKDFKNNSYDKTLTTQKIGKKIQAINTIYNNHKIGHDAIIACNNYRLETNIDAIKLATTIQHLSNSPKNIAIRNIIACISNNRIIDIIDNKYNMIRFTNLMQQQVFENLTRKNNIINTKTGFLLARSKQSINNTPTLTKLIRASIITTQPNNIIAAIKNIKSSYSVDTIKMNKTYKNISLIQSLALKKAHKILFADNDIVKNLSLYRRLWMIRNNDKLTDSIILPSDYDYPVKIESFNSAINGYSKIEWQSHFAVYDRPLIVKLYDKQYNLIELFLMQEDYKNWLFYNQTTSEGRLNVETANKITTCSLTIFNPQVAYVTIQQPKDSNGYTAWYAVAEPILAQRHPIPIGNDLGLRELPVPIEILIETINILLLMWNKFFMAFTGQTGTQAISGLCATFHEWISLATSKEQAGTNIKYYYRMWRWLRWEAECLLEKAKYDPELTGNYWVEQLLTEMQNYMLQHHFNYMPTFKDIEKMDEHRNIFNSPDKNIDFILDKYKGLRNRRI